MKNKQMNKLIKLDPWFITGFTDAEGCFSLSIVRNKEIKVGWGVKIRFEIGLHEKDKALLEQIQFYFSVGNIYKYGSQLFDYRVQSTKDLAKVISHFDKYGLITQKRADYELFKQAFILILNKEHLTSEGLAKIVAIKASMNKGLSEELKTAFPDVLPIPRPSVVNQEIKDPNWLAGFTSGEGCFLVRITNSATLRSGYQVFLVFKLVQHSRDIALMKSLVKYLGCGNIYVGDLAVEFRVTKFSDLTDKIIPLFQKYTIQGVKHLDYTDFVSVIELMKNKKHLTEEGLDKIRTLKAGMNRGRK